MAARSFKYGNFSHPLTVHRAVDGVAVLSGNSSYVKTTVPDGAAWATVVVFPCSGQVDSFVKATAANEPPPTSGFAVQHLWPDELKGGAHGKHIWDPLSLPVVAGQDLWVKVDGVLPAQPVHVAAGVVPINVFDVVFEFGPSRTGSLPFLPPGEGEVVVKDVKHNIATISWDDTDVKTDEYAVFYHVPHIPADPSTRPFGHMKPGMVMGTACGMEFIGTYPGVPSAMRRMRGLDATHTVQMVMNWSTSLDHTLMELTPDTEYHVEVVVRREDHHSTLPTVDNDPYYQPVGYTYRGYHHAVVMTTTAGTGSTTDEGLSVGAIIGIVVGAIAVVALVVGVFVVCRRPGVEGPATKLQEPATAASA
ncbi:hypothetical protein FNF27_04612 [Cafeteria roenbergensis]|uniref:Uncharacterized protein n=1 Tax=Cafeteria roenbergensis TaxID=33653 RepID=A0A5A8E7Z1_CAFRO|nr:hypothetical protein FNF27_04612 [Cafeteria roenbergensis]